MVILAFSDGRLLLALFCAISFAAAVVAQALAVP